MSSLKEERESLVNIQEEILAEYHRSVDIYGKFKSYYEGYAVIEEELDEFWDEIKKRQPSKQDLRDEAIQFAAMGLKFIAMLDEV